MFELYEPERFVNLAALCPELEDLLLLGDYVPLVDCPHCIEGWAPDPDAPARVMHTDIPGVVVFEVKPIPCEECGATGATFWFCNN